VLIGLGALLVALWLGLGWATSTGPLRDKPPEEEVSVGGAAHLQEPLGPGPLSATSDAEAQQALASVLAAEQAYHEEHGEYTDEHADEVNNVERLTGVSVPGVKTDYGFFPRDENVVLFWVGYDDEENTQIPGALYLSVFAEEGRCFYARANGDEVLTAVDAKCGDGTELRYSEDAWVIP
jgi:hypothetical protein